MPKVGFNFEVGGWDQLNRSLEDKSLPLFVEEQRLALETAAKDAVALKAKHRRLRAETLVVSRRLRETIASGRQAESRLRAYLKAEYGATNPQLIRHGIKPRPRGRSSEASAPTLAAPAAPEPAATELVAEDPAPPKRPPARSRRRDRPRP